MSRAIENTYQHVSPGADPASAGAGLRSLLPAFRLLRALDPSLDQAAMQGILNGACTRGVGSVANLCIALGDALGEEFEGIADPAALLLALGPALAAGRWTDLRIEPLAGRSIEEAAAEDSPEGSAYRFALQHLHSFVLIAAATTAGSVCVPMLSPSERVQRAAMLQGLLDAPRLSSGLTPAAPGCAHRRCGQGRPGRSLPRARTPLARWHDGGPRR